MGGRYKKYRLWDLEDAASLPVLFLWLCLATGTWYIGIFSLISLGALSLRGWAISPFFLQNLKWLCLFHGYHDHNHSGHLWLDNVLKASFPLASCTRSTCRPLGWLELSQRLKHSHWWWKKNGMEIGDPPKNYFQNDRRERFKKKIEKKLTNVSFMYVCVAGNGEMLVFFSFFPPTIVW